MEKICICHVDPDERFVADVGRGAMKTPRLVMGRKSLAVLK